MSWWIWALITIGAVLVGIWALGMWVESQANRRSLGAMSPDERAEFEKGRHLGHYSVSAAEWAEGVRPRDKMKDRRA